MPHCPFSLSQLVKVTGTGQVVHKAEKTRAGVFLIPAAAVAVGRGT